MKIAVTGKGGVGKTTIAAAFAFLFKSQDKEVIAIDADPDSNLASTLGFPSDIRPEALSGMKKLIRERVGEVGTFFKLNPEVGDIPQKFAVEYNGIKLLEMGTVKRGGAGCVCPESTFLKAVLSHLIIKEETAVILDMEAGIEHLGRGTAANVDIMVIVVEPNLQSAETALRIKKLAADIGIKKIAVIANKINSEGDEEFIDKSLKGLEIAGWVKFDEKLMESRGAVKEDSGIVEEVREIARSL